MKFRWAGMGTMIAVVACALSLAGLGCASRRPGSEDEIETKGTNAKMYEFQVLMGLTVLPHPRSITAARATVANVYRERLREMPGVHMPPPLPHDVAGNHAYLPVKIIPGDARLSRDNLHARLRDYNIFTRRYFHPLLTDCAAYRDPDRSEEPAVARRVARQILTLPIHHDLPAESVHRVCAILRQVLSP